MATQRRSWFVGSLAGVLLGSTFACGQVDPAELTQVAPPVKQPAPPPPGPPPAAAAVPLVGGTLLVLRDGKTAVAADPDRNVVWVVDLISLRQTARVDLQSGDEPGRLVEDGAGKVHVALRRGGAVVAIDPAAGRVLSRRAACPAPRGIDYDPASDRLHLACAGGELVTFAAGGGAAVRTLHLDSDLRDVIVQGDHLLVSRFRSAELLTIDATGAVSGRVRPKSVAGSQINGGPMGGMLGTADPAVAWRVRPLADGRIAMLFERGTNAPIDLMRPGGYGNGQCKGAGIVSGAMTILGGAGEQPGPTLPFVAYAIDFAIAPDGSALSFVVPEGGAAGRPNVSTVSMANMTPSDPCSVFPSSNLNVANGSLYETVAIAYDPQKRLVVQTRNPARIVVNQSEIVLQDAADVGNPGHLLFHTPTASSIACVSCHPEAGDDGRVWNFTPTGPRRTQNLRGGLLATAPFHWDGDMTDMNKLMTTVFVGRMGGPQLAPAGVTAVADWLDAQPALPKAPPADPQAVARGKQLFEDAAVGCAGCHSGAHFTNNTTVAVGTGGSFQVPSLIGVAMRAPYMHTGCANTLADRFNPACGGGDSHGKTSQLSDAQRGDLISYLQTL
jgi:mono/diheme cytochrome c family protein